jgi:hypothetical protein
MTDAAASKTTQRSVVKVSVKISGLPEEFMHLNSCFRVLMIGQHYYAHRRFWTGGCYRRVMSFESNLSNDLATCTDKRRGCGPTHRLTPTRLISLYLYLSHASALHKPAGRVRFARSRQDEKLEK